MAYRQAEQRITLSERMDAVVDALEAERTQTVLFIAAPKSSKAEDDLNTAQNATDQAVRAVQGFDVEIDDDSLLRSAYAGAMNRLSSIKALRAVATKLPASTAITKYSEFTADLIALDDVIVTDGAELTAGTRAWAGLARAKDAAGQENDRITAALLAGRFESGGLTKVATARSQRDSQLGAFRAASPLTWKQDFDDTVAGSGLDRAEAIRQRVITVAGESPKGLVAPLGASDVPDWLTDSNSRVDGMELVETRLIAALGDRSRELQSDARAAAVRDVMVLLLVLLAVLVATLTVANSLVRPLRRLRAGALDVAGKALPALVSKLRDPGAATGTFVVEPIDIDTTDEIGQVARAFDEVHREAVRLAANEAVLRGDISSMFVNLSRRSQSLIERQLKLIDDLEQGERDEERLAALFRLDHLATRMRRNCENLLVLGGQDQVRRWNRPVPLVNVVRGALSEVEQFERVELQVQNDVMIAGSVVNDLIHLVAELIENAIVFSPDHTPIIVSGSVIGGGLMVQITDQGIGMTAEELTHANQRLGTTTSTDVSAARRMGLFVVGRLAARHGIRVELRSTVTGGVTAFALLPVTAIASPGQPQQPQQPQPVGVGAGTQGMPVYQQNGMAPQYQNGAAPHQQNGRPPTADPLPSVWPSQGQQPQRPPAVHAQGDTGGWPAVGFPAQNGGWPTAAGQGGEWAGANPPPAQGPSDVRPAQAAPQPPFPAQDRQPPAPPAAPPAAETERPGGGVWPKPPEGRPAAERQEPGRLGRPTWRNTQDSPDTTTTSEFVPVSRRDREPWRKDEVVSEAKPQMVTEGSPIFEAMTSEWFMSRDATGRAVVPDPEAWRTPADDGWQQAETISVNPAADGRTSAGLPQRVPGQNRLLGAVPPAGNNEPAPVAGAPGPEVPAGPGLPGSGAPDPEQLQAAADARRARYGGFQRGVRRGRAENQTGTETTGEST
ncbi:nitrate- and nitrite sensing domain-containing protein [Actinocorallia longicatena]